VDGSLWVAGGHGSAWDPRDNAIARVSPDLQVHSELSNFGFRVWEIDVAKDGSVWLLVEDLDPKRLRLVRLAAGQNDAPTSVAEFPAGVPRYLRVFGSEIVVLLSETGVDTPTRSLMISRDLGASWTKLRLPEDGVRVACALNADKIWLVGSSGAVYPPI
jgi:hypothetical protein